MLCQKETRNEKTLCKHPKHRKIQLNIESQELTSCQKNQVKGISQVATSQKGKRRVKKAQIKKLEISVIAKTET